MRSSLNLRYNIQYVVLQYKLHHRKRDPSRSMFGEPWNQSESMGWVLVRLRSDVHIARREGNE